jgi:hypothetical protein
MEMAAPLQPLFAKLSSTQKNDAKNEIKNEVDKYKRENGIALPMTIRIVVARKPD